MTHSTIYLGKNKTKKLTITTHSSSNTFLEPTILASISVYSQNVALLIFGAGSILDFLLNRPTEKSLKKTRKKNMNKKRKSYISLKKIILNPNFIEILIAFLNFIDGIIWIRLGGQNTLPFVLL